MRGDRCCREPPMKEKTLRDEPCVPKGCLQTILSSTPSSLRPERLVTDFCVKGGLGYHRHKRMKEKRRRGEVRGPFRLDTLCPYVILSTDSFRCGAAIVALGRIAQRESTCLTSRGSEVRHLLRPPPFSSGRSGRFPALLASMCPPWLFRQTGSSGSRSLLEP